MKLAFGIVTELLVQFSCIHFDVSILGMYAFRLSNLNVILRNLQAAFIRLRKNKF